MQNKTNRDRERPKPPPIPEDAKKKEGPPPIPEDAKTHGVESRQTTEQTNEQYTEQVRHTFVDIVSDKDIPPETALELIASGGEVEDDEEMAEHLESYVSDFGLDFYDFTDIEQDVLTRLYTKLDNAETGSEREEVREILESKMESFLTARAFERLEAFESLLVEARDPDALKDGLRVLMEGLKQLADRLPAEDDKNAEAWKVINNKYRRLVGAKKSEQTAERARRAFSEVFEEFSDFIEDDLLAYTMERMREEGKRVNVEKVTHEMYGRTPEEVEQIKQRNRERVVEEMEKMKDEYALSIDMIETLHRLNNKGVVPKGFSEVRGKDVGEDDDGQDRRTVTFGRRVGLMNEDVLPEMEAFIDRANNMLDQAAIKGYSDTRFATAAAQLHNQLLDMHPFSDRNGSTSLLVLELLMSQRGYEPPKTRETDYYKKLRNVLDDNPAAISVVGYEQFLIKYKSGYYKGETIPKEKRKRYKMAAKYRNDVVNEMMSRMKQQQQ